jgi:Tfp pilus assembly PilM family ATPase
MSTFSALFGSPIPDAVLEIGSNGIAVAVLAARGNDAVIQGYAIEPLPAGAVVVSLGAQNIVDRTVVIDRLRAALTRLNVQPRRVALLLPDLAGRVSLVRFDRVPPRAEDLEQLIRWQVKKAAPFPIEDAVLTYVLAASTPGGGSEYLTLLARRDVVRGYESVCEALGMQPGLVDLSTLGVINLCLATPSMTEGDWLLVHTRHDYSSLAIVRGGRVVFFRSLSGEDADSLVDVIHQTTMYYQDRLGGAGFSSVLLAGVEDRNGSEDLRRSLEARVNAPVQRVDPSRLVAFADRITTNPEVLAWLTPLVGTWMRMRAEASAA